MLYKASIAVLSRKGRMVKAQAEPMPRGEVLCTLAVHDDADKVSPCRLIYPREGTIQEGQAIENLFGHDVVLEGSLLSPVVAYSRRYNKPKKAR